jgi:autotransporter-associated beta strand protein
MRPRRIFSIALTLGLLLWPAGLARVTQAQPSGNVRVANSGVIRLGAGQIVRLTINGQGGNDKLVVRFRRMYYVGSANGGVWKTNGVTEDTSSPVALAADEAASADISQAGFDAVRILAIVSGYTGTTHVNSGTLQIINSDGSVVAFLNSFPSE